MLRGPERCALRSHRRIGNPNITDQLLKGVKLGDRTYRNHLDGYNQMDLITGKGPSNRHEIFYLGESTVAETELFALV